MNIKKIIDKIAKKEGISRKQVLNEMQKAIDEGFTNPDPQIKAEWAKIPCKGSRPTPEELIEYEVSKLKVIETYYMKSSDLRKKSKKIKEMDENKKSHDKKTLLRR